MDGFGFLVFFIGLTVAASAVYPNPMNWTFIGVGCFVAATGAIAVWLGGGFKEYRGPHR